MDSRFALSALLMLASVSSVAAVPGEIIAVFQNHFPGGWAVVSPDGSNLTYLPCVGDPTRQGMPRFFLTSGAGGNVLFKDANGTPTRWSSELVAADEDCVQSIVLSNEGNKFIYHAKWSPDGYMIAVTADEFDTAAYKQVHAGIYLADVVFTGNRPTGVTNFRQVAETNFAIGLVMPDWSPDSGRIVYTGNGGDLFVYDIGTGTARNITGTPGISRLWPTWSSRGRIAYSRVSQSSRGGDQIDIFSIPENGGAELRITGKGTATEKLNKLACYSPDGEYISFVSGGYVSYRDPSADTALYKIKADGTGKAIKILGADGESWTFNRWRR